MENSLSAIRRAVTYREAIACFSWMLTERYGTNSPSGRWLRSFRSCWWNIKSRTSRETQLESTEQRARSPSVAPRYSSSLCVKQMDLTVRAEWPRGYPAMH